MVVNRCRDPMSQKSEGDPSQGEKEKKDLDKMYDLIADLKCMDQDKWKLISGQRMGRKYDFFTCDMELWWKSIQKHFEIFIL